LHVIAVPTVSSATARVNPISAVLVVCSGGALAILHRTGLLRRILGVDIRDLVMPSLFISLFLSIQSALAVYLGHAIGAGRLPAIPDLLVALAYLLAWLAGLVVPGAPGGLGVREGVLVFLLGGVSGEAFAVALAVAMRFVSTTGEAIFALVGFPLYHFGPKRLKRHDAVDNQPE